MTVSIERMRMLRKNTEREKTKHLLLQLKPISHENWD